MNPDHWMNLINTYEVVGGVIEDLLPITDARPPEVDDAATPERETARMERLAEALRLEVTALMRSVQDELNPEESALWAMPFVIHFDEMVTQRLSTTGAVRWPLLQHEFYGFRDGGERFFEQLQEALDGQAPFASMAPYLYCLRRGFKGRYLAQPRVLAKWVEALSDGIEKPDLMSVSEAQEDGLTPRGLPLQWVYYAMTAVLILLTPFLLQAWSNTVGV